MDSISNIGRPVNSKEPLSAANVEGRDEIEQLRSALSDILSLAEDYLKSAPSHPDNAKLETARALLKD